MGATQPPTWISVARAAGILGEHPENLRKRLARAARSTERGTEAVIDGLRARKLGRHWKVRLDEGWTGGE